MYTRTLLSAIRVIHRESRETYGSPSIWDALIKRGHSVGEHHIARLMRTLKEELLCLREWTNPLEVEQSLPAWVQWYNTRYLHSALGYRTQCQVEQQHRTNHSTQFVGPLDKWGALQGELPRL